MMIPGIAETIRSALPADRAVSLSGYQVSVDWGASAVFEILYLDLILGRGLSPQQAARIAIDELNFAGDSPTLGSPLGTLRFRIDPD